MKRAWHKLRFIILWPGLFIYFYRSTRARVIIVSGDKILLTKDTSRVWFDDERWSVPGGGIEHRESPADGAVRELKEELGIVATPADLEFLWEGNIHAYGLRYKAYFFLLQIDQSVELTLQASEIAEATWLVTSKLTMAELKPEAQQALKLLRDH